MSRWYDLISGSSERPARERGVEMLDIQPGERTLEIGCGTGEALSALAARAGHAGGVLGLDLSANMLRRARSKLMRRASSNVALTQGDASRLPFADETFAAVFISFTLELFPLAEIPEALHECRRILRPTGRMGIVSLLEVARPNLIEKLYTRAHLRWPAVIDCQPIPLFSALRESGFTAHPMEEQSLWGLTVGIVIAHPT